MEAPQTHKPVLTQEVLQYLDPQPGGVYVDATLGGGGHARAILQYEPTCTVIGFDWDQKVIDSTAVVLQEEFPGRFFPVWGNFARIDLLIKKAGFAEVQGILADFGTSQIQIFETAGLSLYQDTFLDMRMSPSHFKTTAYHVVNKFSEKELIDIFYIYGEESHARKIARAIVEERKKKRIKTTGQLVNLIVNIIPRKNKKIHQATKVFQALRIFVNQELENISSFLNNAAMVLDDQGRLVCISFHSLEDRLVKRFFKDRVQRNYPSRYFETLTKKVCVATDEELVENKSARSARLRAGILHI